MNTITLWEIIANTPWWVFVLFIYLLFVGFSATKKRIVPFKRLIIVPSLMFFCSLPGLIKLFTAQNFYFFYWLSALGLGFAFGFIHFKLLKIKAIRSANAIAMNGSYGLLIILLSAFFIKYAMSFEVAVDPTRLLNPQYERWHALFYGLFLGIFIGRIYCAHRCLKFGPYLERF